MKCPRCGVDVGDQAKFCSSCGVVIERPGVEARRAPRLPARAMIVAALVVAGILIALAVVMALLRPRNPEQPLVQSPTNVPHASSPITQTPGQPYAPRQPLSQADVPPAPRGLQPPVEEKAPPEVIEYINFVKGIEERRKSMRVDFSPALDMLKDAYGAQLGLALDDSEEQTPPKVNKGYSDYIQNWNQLVQTFDRVQPPEPCRQFAGAYRQALGSYVSAMSKIQVAMAQNDINTLMAMRSRAQPDIDVQLRQADRQLAELTKRYRLEKTFTITPDREVDSILGQ